MGKTNYTLKRWMTHPVLLGALIGVGIGSVYLMFNANLEDEKAENPINIAIANSQSTLSLDTLDEKIQEESNKVVLNLDDVAQTPRVLTMAEKQKLKEESQALAKQELLPVPALPKEEPVKDVTRKIEKEVEKVASTAHFTIQLLGSSSEANVKKFIAHHGLEKKAQYVRSMRGQKEWFVVYYGHYATMEEAKAAILTMPPSLKKEGVAPWVKRA